MAHRGLTILCCITNIFRVGADDIGISAFERGNDVAGIINAQRRLRDIRDWCMGRNVDCIHIFFILHEDDGGGDMTEGSFDFRMAGMADQDERAPYRHIALALIVHFGDERACRI